MKFQAKMLGFWIWEKRVWGRWRLLALEWERERERSRSLLDTNGSWKRPEAMECDRIWLKCLEFLDTTLSFSMRDKQNLPALLQVIDFQPDDHSNSIRVFNFFYFFISWERERERERERGGGEEKKYKEWKKLGF